MNTHFFIKNQEVHLWRVYFPTFMDKSDSFVAILSQDEIKRANRFHFENHRKHFIIARYFLRQTLGLYINVAPEAIEFSYTQYGKPYLKTNPHDIYFNTSHSHEIAIYGLTCHREIGVDIEKTELESKMPIAKRFFSEEEYTYLLSLPDNKKNEAFYTLWARKEAVIKVLGKGLYTPLNQFSILRKDLSKNIILNDGNRIYHLLIENISIDKDYQAAFAILPPVTHISYWEWTNTGPNVWGNGY